MAFIGFYWLLLTPSTLLNAKDNTALNVRQRDVKDVWDKARQQLPQKNFDLSIFAVLAYRFVKSLSLLLLIVAIQRPTILSA